MAIGGAREKLNCNVSCQKSSPSYSTKHPLTFLCDCSLSIQWHPPTVLPHRRKRQFCKSLFFISWHLESLAELQKCNCFTPIQVRKGHWNSLVHTLYGPDSPEAVQRIWVILHPGSNVPLCINTADRLLYLRRKSGGGALWDVADSASVTTIASEARSLWAAAPHQWW